MLAIILKFEVGFIRLISRIHKLFCKNQPNGQEIKQGMHKEEKGMFGHKVLPSKFLGKMRFANNVITL
jgi:hypothetical protein